MIYKDDNNSLVPKNNAENIIYTKKKKREERQNNRLKLYDEELKFKIYVILNSIKTITSYQKFKEVKSNDTKTKNKIRDDVGKNNKEKNDTNGKKGQSNRLKC